MKRNNGILLIFTIIILNCVMTHKVSAVKSISKNDAIAYFILNSAYFGSWPEAKDIIKTKTLKIAVVNNNGLIKPLEKISQKATKSWFKDGNVEIRKAVTKTNLSKYHIVFLGNLNKTQIQHILKKYAKKPIIFISSFDGFIQLGGSIEIDTKKEKLKFSINLDALIESEVKLSSRFKIRAERLLEDGVVSPNS